MQEIRLKLTVSEVNEILDALGQKPYSAVYRLITSIHEQAAGQLDPEGDGLSPTETPPERPEGGGA